MKTIQHPLFRTLLTAVMLIFAANGSAQHITAEQACQKATRFFSKAGVKAFGTSELTLAYSPLPKGARAVDEANYYVFNAPEGQGFVIISGDERTDEVIGYSTGGAFNANNMPDHVEAWMRHFSQQIEDIPRDFKPSVKARNIDDITSARLLRPIAPLIKSQWNQNWPYWNLCPNYGGTNCYTGCVATAMAQLMYYYEWPQTYTGMIPAFQTYSLGLQMGQLQPTLFDWEDMAPTYSYYSSEVSNTQSNNAVALLMQYCGRALKMNYNTTGSAAYSSNVAMALKTYFDYDSSTSYMSKGYTSNADWEKILYDELSASRPVYYAGSNESSGHAFIIDGTDGNGLYHVNWGWGGSCDGYFKLTDLNPNNTSGPGAGTSTNGYSLYQEMVIGIKPSTTAAMEDDVFLYSTIMSYSTPNLSVKYTNRNDRQRFFRYGLAIRNNDGSYTVLKDIRSKNVLSKDATVSGISYNLATLLTNPGNYILVPVSRQENHKTWKAQGDSYAKVTRTTSGKFKIKIMRRKSTLKTKLTLPANPTAGINQSIIVSVSGGNTGYSGMLYLFADKSNKKGVFRSNAEINVASGSVGIATLSFKPLFAGKFKVWICSDDKGKNVLCEGEMDVIPPSSR